jgi:hypothetical protein
MKTSGSFQAQSGCLCPTRRSHRIVNVSAKPGGRFGAPETEPGHSSVPSGAEDEVMRTPFARPDADRRHHQACSALLHVAPVKGPGLLPGLPCRRQGAATSRPRAVRRFLAASTRRTAGTRARVCPGHAPGASGPTSRSGDVVGCASWILGGRARWGAAVASWSKFGRWRRRRSNVRNRGSSTTRGPEHARIGSHTIGVASAKRPLPE